MSLEIEIILITTKVDIPFISNYVSTNKKAIVNISYH